MSQKSLFSNPSLSNTYNEIESSLVARRQFLDSLSGDILSLEKTLGEAVCPLGLSLEYKKDFECDILKSISDANFDEYFNRIFCGHLIEKSHRLYWGKSPSKGTRLLHQVQCRTYDVFFHNDGHPAVEVWREEVSNEQEDLRPLIECSADTRIQVSDHLPLFLAGLGDVLNTPLQTDLKRHVSKDEDQWLEIWKNEAITWHPLPDTSDLLF